MARVFLGLIIVFSLFFLATKYLQSPDGIKSGLVNNSQKNSNIDEKIIFVPYWTLDAQGDTSTYNTVIYFGISANEEGLVSDPGLKNVDRFYTKTSPGQKTLLTLSLTDNNTNTKILESQKVQDKIINEAIAYAKQHNFDGIVIDFETKSIGFAEITQKTTDFLTSSLKKIKHSDLEADALIFGDTYYRARAFDVPKIAQASDNIMIMAYDFHKSGGGIPGPTFPTYGENTYGYDFVKMLDEFTKDAPSDKIAVILGMFGYDWGESEQSTSLTTRQAKNIFLGDCQKSDCKVTIDPDSKEARIIYKDNSKKHEAWVETEDSASIKIKEMQKRGISKVGYWAYSFF